MTNFFNKLTGVPQSAIAMLEFRQKVRDAQKLHLKNLDWKGHPLGPPIIVHCSAGIGRTGEKFFINFIFILFY